MPSERYWTADDLERVTGTPAATFRWWATQAPEKGPASFRLGKRRLWKKDVAERWLAEQEGQTGPVPDADGDLKSLSEQALALTDAQRAALVELLRPARRQGRR